MSATAPNRHLTAAALGLGFGIVAMLVADVIADALWLFLPLALLAFVAAIYRWRTPPSAQEQTGPAPHRHRLRLLPWLRQLAFWVGFCASIAFGVWQAWCLTCERLLIALTEVAQ